MSETGPGVGAWEKIIPSTKPLSCPCCGGVPQETWSPLEGIAFRCKGCSMQSARHSTRTGALAAWNRRQPAPPVPEMEGMIPMVLYFADREDAEACASEIAGTFKHRVEIGLP